MSAAVGTPEGGVSQPASGESPKKAIVAANAFERMRPGPECIIFAPDMSGGRRWARGRV